MDTTNLTIHNIPYSSPDWLKFRKSGIGGSEIGVLFSESTGGEYHNPAKLYYEKIGVINPFKNDNENMFWGRTLEEDIADKWQYWDGKYDEFGNPGYLKNFAENNIIRKCRRLNGYAVNKKYPWLFASVDRIINQGAINLITGEVMSKEGVLEVKTISGFVVDKWISGIPPSYLFQVQQYMLILELDYCEFAILKDGRNLDVFAVERSEILQEQIVERSEKFWKNRVLPAREAFIESERLKRFGREMDAEKYETIIQNLEPSATPGDSYKYFIKERFKQERQPDATGTLFQLSVCRQYDTICKIANQIESQKSLLYNVILKEFQRTGVHKIDFGRDGYVKFNKMLSNKVKNDIDLIEMGKVISELNMTYGL